ncbi:putative nucleic-acid-binding protein / ribosomal protein L7Ae family protein [Aurantiacibacter gangjinensis]|nr:putative nucleic-acid-binding protein / ribosomal protein L7Ae family protein [Aurantiacibacter gangjinensis]
MLTGRNAARDELVRLAVSPDGDVLPDANAKAPGRGAWIGVSRQELEDAIASGRLKGALSRAFKTGALAIPADLPVRLAGALEKALLDRLGLEMRSGRLILGSDRIANDARMGKVAALYHAADAKEDGRRKLDQAWRVGLDEEGSGRHGETLPLDRQALSVALGRENVVHLALADAKSAQRVSVPLARLQMYLGAGEAAPSLSPPAGE